MNRARSSGTCYIPDVTVAELAILALVWFLLVWLLRPLQRAVRNRVERFGLRRRHGQVIEGRFKPVAVAPKEPTFDPERPQSH